MAFAQRPFAHKGVVRYRTLSTAMSPYLTLVPATVFYTRIPATGGGGKLPPEHSKL